MAAKMDVMLDAMAQKGISLPAGTGKDGRVLAKDLRTALGNFFFKLRYPEADSERAKHCTMRRAVEPMKAFRFNELPVTTQNVLLTSLSWWEEEKFNGWRLMCTYRPESGFCIWGSNHSVVDFLPLDYTEHVLFNGMRPYDEAFINMFDFSFMFDVEALCSDIVESKRGTFSGSTLDAIGSILSLPPDEAVALQLSGTKVDLKVFDLLNFVNEKPVCRVPYTTRRMSLFELALSKPLPCEMSIAHAVQVNKDEFLKRIWRKGGEGTVLKQADAFYVPGGRQAGVAVKVKRTMSGAIGDDLDAYVTGFVQGEEWQKRGMIGGVTLSVFMVSPDGAEDEHVIATVSAMSDDIRAALTEVVDGVPQLRQEYYNRVLTIDGQELSCRNRKLLHARADWERGFRDDKSPEDCRLSMETIGETLF